MRRSLPWVAVATAAIACYASTLGHDLALDDKQITTSPLLARPFDVLAVWRNEFLAPGFRYLALYRPLSFWTLLLNWRANEILLGDGAAGAGFHAVNVLLHAGACLFLLAWLAKLPLERGVPFVAALLFAVHPVHSEAVASVSARSEPLALLFGLAFLIAHGRGRTILAALLYLAAMWCKESGVLFAGVALAAELVFRAPGRPLPLARFSVYAAVLGLWLGMRWLALRGAEPVIAYLDNPAATASAFQRVLTSAAVQLDYLRLLAWPARQSVDYAYAHTRVVESPSDPRVLLFAAVFAAAIAAAFLLRRRAPFVALSVVGYGLLFALTSNFLFPIGTIQAERLAYAPSAFFCLLAGGLLVRIARALSRSAALAGLLALAAALGSLAWRASRVWKDDGTLVRSAIATAGDSAKAHLLFGRVLESEGDLPGAAREYRESARIFGGYGRTWLALGDLCHRTGETEPALEAWRTALRADPGLADARAHLASALLDLSRRAEALAETWKLFGADPLDARLRALQDRLAASAAPEEASACQASLDIARAALAAGEAQSALLRAQDAIRGGGLRREARSEALEVLAASWSRLGSPVPARLFAQAADNLRAAE